MLGESITLITGSAGALMGAGLAYALTRSRLHVTVSRVSISPSGWISSLPAPVNAALLQKVAQSPINLPGVSGTSMPERGYVQYLGALAEILEDYKLQLDGLEKVARDLRRHALDEEFSTLIDLYKLHQEALWNWAAGEARRGVQFFDSPDDETPEVPIKQAKYPIHLHNNGHRIQLPGTLSLYFPWDPTLPEPEVVAVKSLSVRIARAFTCHVRTDLTCYFEGIHSGVDEARKNIRELEHLVAAEKDAYARLQLDLLLSNTGRSGVSVSSRAGAVVNLKGYLETASGGSSSKVPENVKITMRVATDTRVAEIKHAVTTGAKDELRIDELRPIVLQGGETVRLLGTSERMLSEHEHGAGLMAAYGGAERSMRINLMRFRQPHFFQRRNHNSGKAIRSRKVLFRDVRMPD